MSVQTETDIRSFEGALDEKWCHCRRGSSQVALCGEPLIYQQPHLIIANRHDTRCSGCQRLKCPDCERIWWAFR